MVSIATLKGTFPSFLTQTHAREKLNEYVITSNAAIATLTYVYTPFSFQHVQL